MKEGTKNKKKTPKGLRTRFFRCVRVFLFTLDAEDYKMESKITTECSWSVIHNIYIKLLAVLFRCYIQNITDADDGLVKQDGNLTVRMLVTIYDLHGNCHKFVFNPRS